MIAAGLFTYPPEHLSGLRIGLAPIEDFSYAGVRRVPRPRRVHAARPRAPRRAEARMTAAPPLRPRAVARQLLIASRPVSWINTAYPFAAAYLLTTREIDATLVDRHAVLPRAVQPRDVRHQRRLRLRVRPPQSPQGRRARRRARRADAPDHAVGGGARRACRSSSTSSSSARRCRGSCWRRASSSSSSTARRRCG